MSCGAPPPGRAPQSLTTQRSTSMAKLKNYDVVVNGLRTTVQYSDEDAKRLGLTGKDTGSAAAKRKAAADAKAEADAKADADAKAEADAKAAEAAKAKAAPAPANKAAAAPANK
ncbi:hypothetical protein SEA_AOKA_8 [Arthrobacter phage Aoka]|nr:hypothetical protein SEA_AOKA_8 [Arthrobacter phage Aoka]